jgi:hypothetical protein
MKQGLVPFLVFFHAVVAEEFLTGRGGLSSGLSSGQFSLTSTTTSTTYVSPYGEPPTFVLGVNMTEWDTNLYEQPPPNWKRSDGDEFHDWTSSHKSVWVEAFKMAFANTPNETIFQTYLSNAKDYNTCTASYTKFGKLMTKFGECKDKIGGDKCHNQGPSGCWGNVYNPHDEVNNGNNAGWGLKNDHVRSDNAHNDRLNVVGSLFPNSINEYRNVIRISGKSLENVSCNMWTGWRAAVCKTCSCAEKVKFEKYEKLIFQSSNQIWQKQSCRAWFQRASTGFANYVSSYVRLSIMMKQMAKCYTN